LTEGDGTRLAAKGTLRESIDAAMAAPTTPTEDGNG